MKIQYNLIFENKKHEKKYTKFKILNVLTFLMYLLQYMISPEINKVARSLVYETNKKEILDL
jgi:hypothetical protein